MAVWFAKCRRCRSANLQKPEYPIKDSIVICLDCGAGEKWADLERRMVAQQ